MGHDRAATARPERLDAIRGTPELDRLGRSQTEMIQLFTELTAMGVHVNVLGGPIPLDTRVPGPATEMAKALLIFLGQVEASYPLATRGTAHPKGEPSMTRKPVAAVAVGLVVAAQLAVAPA
ncbi:hypothetical protein ACFV9C_38170 [Kribbella sp. NPDC059898]|uniref:hypothetical protein n=1 Tax=Kribbella sp. NPDC059898 TaxID=3346995 RepID=UPI00364D3566